MKTKMTYTVAAQFVAATQEKLNKLAGAFVRAALRPLDVDYPA